MDFPVIKGVSYILVHAPDMVLYHGTTQTSERKGNPDSSYLKNISRHLRSFEDFVAYPPNQTYIGNITPEDLEKYERPWYDKKVDQPVRKGKYGEMMPQDEFIGLMKLCDSFDLISLEQSFTENMIEKLSNHPVVPKEWLEKQKEGVALSEIEDLIKDHIAVPIYHDSQLVGCVKRAHEIDKNLDAPIIFENIVTKASGSLALLQLMNKNKLNPNSIQYIIECSEEACGDMNQRGGGNFAKAIAEISGCMNATGSDTRSFCAAPAHALVQASALVQSGIYENVVIVAGGSPAKLGMNGKDHVKKGMPILEDALGGFAILISKNDGINPILRTDLVGRHTVGTGSSPQAVITSLVTEPLERDHLKILDVDKYSVEMQNPDITKPAGAGDVPYANYKMIAALGVKRGELDRSEVSGFAQKHGMPGWAPTQGHIPSGVPYIGFARDFIMNHWIQRVMIIGKGSLFLGRMTNLFDGISIVMEKNNGFKEEVHGISEDTIKKIIAGFMREYASQLLGE